MRQIIWLSKSDYLSAFITCFLPIVVIYYPLMICGSNFAKEGKLHPTLDTWAANGAMGAIAGEVQLTHRAMQGPRSDYDLLRILSHQLNMLGLGTPIRLRTAEAALDEIRQNVAGYDLSPAALLAGGSELGTASSKAPEAAYESPAGAVFSSQDYLFTSGTLGRYCSRLTSTNEAKQTPWSSSPSTQSWWQR